MALFEPFPILDTPRLRLRALTLDDTPAMHRLDADPRVAQYFGRPPSASRAAMHERVVALIDNTASERAGFWVLADRDTDALLGTACLWNWDREAAIADIGYLLDPARWGEGLMHEALVPVLEFGRTRMGLRRVEARVDPDNLASIRVLDRLEFRKIGKDEHESIYALDLPR